MRAGRWETLGAWLGVWTPPRDVEVPPRPSATALLLGLGAVLVLAGAGYALVAPRIDEGKAERSAREQREEDARRLARVQRARREQRPRRGRAAPGASPRKVVAALERHITRDAVARLERGELRSRVRSTRCEPTAGAPRGVLDCVSAYRTIVGVDEGRRYDAGTLGYPFRAVVDFERRRWVFCKLNPPPGEQVVPDPRYLVELPRVCRGLPPS